MREIVYRTYDLVIEERRRYTVQGSGTSKFEAEQDAVERFHRLIKSGDLVADTVSKPKIISVVLLK